MEILRTWTSGEDACSLDVTRGVWAKLQGFKTFKWPCHAAKMEGANIDSMGDGAPLWGTKNLRTSVFLA